MFRQTPLQNKGNHQVAVVKEKIKETRFINAHKRNLKDFTRNRQLTFQIVLMQLFRKTIKSLQISLNLDGYMGCAGALKPISR